MRSDLPARSTGTLVPPRGRLRSIWSTCSG